MRVLRSILPGLIVLGLLLVPASAEEGRLFEPVFRKGAPSDELISGEPLLSRGHVNAFVDLLESAFDLGLTAPQEQTLRDRIEINFEAAEPELRSSWLELVAAMPRLRDRARAGNRDVVVTGLREFRRDLDARMRERPDHSVHQLVADVLTRRHDVVWRGDPPITSSEADLYLEMAVFVASVGRNEAMKPTVGQLGALREELTTVLHSKPRDLRTKLATIHRTWLGAKAAWDRGGDARRFPFRWRAVRLLAMTSTPDQKIEVEAGPTLQDYAREAAKVAAAAKPYDALSNVARDPKALLETIVGGLKIDPASKEFTFLFR